MELIVFRFDCGYEVSCSSAIARFGCRIALSVSAAKSSVLSCLDALAIEVSFWGVSATVESSS